MRKRILLLILDGFGINESTPEENSITEAHPDKIFHRLFAFPSYTRLEASGRAVGLLDGFMGNSEVGHMTIGSGQIVKQTLLEINDHFSNNTFTSLPAWKSLEERFKQGKTLHIGIMLGFAGVHAYQEHLVEFLKLIPREQSVTLHLWTDGRDSGIQESL
jgi:2,3-bisphosphoglycerate-independent phosphoglycerate mutase